MNTSPYRKNRIDLQHRFTGAATVRLMKNEIMSGPNKPDGLVLQFVEVNCDNARLRRIRQRMKPAPGFLTEIVSCEPPNLLQIGYGSN